MEFIRKNYIKYSVGSEMPNVLVDAQHAVAPRADKYTEEIVTKIVTKIQCNSIIATVSREHADLNRPPNIQNREAIQEFRETINAILKDHNLLDDSDYLLCPFLHVSVHGMLNREKRDMEIGTVLGRSCDAAIEKIFTDKLLLEANQKIGKKVRIENNVELWGDNGKAFHRHGDRRNAYLGYGKNFNTIQLEIAAWIRESYQDEIADAIASTIKWVVSSQLGKGKSL
jgi:hypothetical protein